jgi:hypothetical protein
LITLMFSESGFQSFSLSDMESEENKRSSEEVPSQHLTSQGERIASQHLTSHGEWIAFQHLTSQYFPFFKTSGIKEKPFRSMDSLPFCVLQS